MLGIVARQRRSIDGLMTAMRAMNEERVPELSAVPHNFAEILHDPINRTASAVGEVRAQLPKHQQTPGSCSFSGASHAEIRRVVAGLRRVVLERLRQPSPRVGTGEQLTELGSELAAVRTELRDAAAHHQVVLDLLDVRETIRRCGWTGDPLLDVHRLRSPDTMAKVRLAHQLPCFDVLVSAVCRSPERRMRGAVSLSLLE
ncbi:hypothetical protein DQ04_05241040 [Trypanosoma grayi]|uniref:hypothetical protein n=1 Tax=Trypanosoma grayi TaxID=71804 RepID=UPI0004F44543|nr:hypothetical protein DQ04_05241040 [Trypanosoma grayi]KEG09427.1 hypothetical protein DQ04_05241040 [Trypanosoma grayi]